MAPATSLGSNGSRMSTARTPAMNGRPSDSWELVMPYGVLIHEQRRLVAAGGTVRVAVTQVPGGRS